jgi:hypothetical protein
MRNSEFKFLTKLISVTALLAICAIVNIAQALEYECTAAEEQRFIRLEIPGVEHLCEVSVTLKNGDRDVKWYANNDSSFCTEKTQDLKNKYEELWGFSCLKWPDIDGVDSLNKRQRVILDAELKKQITLGKNSIPSYQIKAIKTTASKSDANQRSIIAVQFFKSSNGVSDGDITYVIRDDGLAWFTEHRLQSLSSYVVDDEEHAVNSAMISTISNDGNIEISTLVSSSDEEAACYGSQTFSTATGIGLAPRTPHRFVCQ